MRYFFLGLLLVVLLGLSAVPGTTKRYTVTAYCHRSRTALGTRPHLGTCAGPRRYLGRYVRIGGQRYRVEDTCGRGFDIWMPTRKACLKFGRRRLDVQIGGRFARRR
jgi:hypothetical protein